MQIGMEFTCQFLECVFDFLVGRRSIYAEGLVRVLHALDPMQASPQLTADRRLRPIAKTSSSCTNSGSISRLRQQQWAGGHTTRPPNSVMKSRRGMSDPKLRRRHLSGSNEYFDRG